MSYLGQQLGQGQAERFVFTASGGETSVTTSDDGRAVAYTVGQVDVYLNGAKLINGSDFTATTGTSITGLSALTASDVVEVFALSIFQASDTVSASTGGTFNGNVTVDASLTVTGTVDIDTSLNVDGTVTADGLTVDGDVVINDSGSGANQLKISHNDAGTIASPEFTDILFTGYLGRDKSRIRSLDINSSAQGGELVFQTTDSNATDQSTLTDRLKISRIGDISFYEDTGTTPKFFWDASAEKLGIGTATPDKPLHIYSSENALLRLESTDASTYIQLNDSNSVGAGYIGYTTDDMEFWTNNVERMRINSNGNVGIGVTPSAWRTAGGEKVLQIDTASIYNNSANDYYLNNNWYLNSSSQNIYIESDYATSFSSSDGKFIWYQAPSGTAGNTISFTQAMTLDASGNLMVGRTNTSFGNTGHVLAPSGFVYHERDGGDSVLYLNRKTSDGDLARFYKDGIEVGSIGTASGVTQYSGSTLASFGAGDVGFFANASNDALYPVYQTSLSGRDAAIDLGVNTSRFKDLYLSGGVYLGGTGAANLLDDYEEGTWTPTVTTGTTSTTDAKYIKIGRKVTLFVSNQTFSDSSTNAAVVVGGLPFGASEHATGSILCSERDDAAAVTPFVSKTSDDVSFYENSSVAGFAQKKHNDFIETTGQLYWTITYYTD